MKDNIVIDQSNNQKASKIDLKLFAESNYHSLKELQFIRSLVMLLGTKYYI